MGPAGPDHGDRPPSTYRLYGSGSLEGLMMVSWNIAGLRRASNPLAGVMDIQSIMSSLDPDILFLQETWLRKQSKFPHPSCLREYKHYKSMSVDAVDHTGRRRKGRQMGGVSTLVKKTLRPDVLISEELVALTPPHIRGYVLPLVLADPRSPLLMMNAYVPPKSGPEDTRRPDVMAGISELVGEYRRRYPGGGVMMMGDFNAAFASNDRHDNTPRPADAVYKAWLRSLLVTPVDYRISDPQLKRQASYSPLYLGLGDTRGPTRIDDFRIDDASSVTGHPMEGTPVRVDTVSAHGSDHKPLVLRIGPVAFEPPPPLPERPPKDRIKVPFTRDMQDKLRTVLAYEMDGHIREFEAQVSILEASGGQGGGCLDGAVKALDVLLQAAEEVTMREAGEKAATEGQRAPTWQQGHLDGKTKHEYQKARTVAAKARAAITQLNTG